VIVCDTAPLVAAALYRDPNHRRCVDLFAGLRMANREMVLPAPIVADYGRMAELVEQYDDLPLGTSDASVVALAERLNITEVATLDLRHFTVVRPRHVRTLTLLPEP
jgi:uncharacterized protein